MAGNPFPLYGYPVVSPDVATIKGLIKAYQPVFVNASGTYDPIWSAADLQYLTLIGNTTIGPVLAPGGAQLLFVLKQDATGGRTVTWDASFQSPLPVIDPTPNAITAVLFVNAWTSTAPVWTAINSPSTSTPFQSHITLPAVQEPLPGSAASAVTLNQAGLSPTSAYRAQTAAALNDKFLYDVPLAGGIWQMDIWYVKASNTGIVTPTLDGTDLATFDGYLGSLASGHATYAGISVAQAGLKRLQLQARSKNAASSNYYIIVAAITFTKTA